MANITDHPFIQSIADMPRWTVSDGKKPIDIWRLFFYGITVGADQHDELCLCSLKDIAEKAPCLLNRQNYSKALPPLTYWCAAAESKFCILDIEKDCPDGIRRELLRLPYLYGEYSSSGKGIHLVMSLPEYYMDYEIAMQKPALKEEHGWYEILLNHFSIFTGNLLDKSANPDGDGNFDKLFYEMASQAKESKAIDFDIATDALDNIPQTVKDAILNGLIKRGKEYKKTLADFNGDHSKYEFSLMGCLYGYLQYVSKGANNMRVVDFDNSTKALFMYLAATEIIPYRPKHDTQRDGMPWLLYEAKEFISKAYNDNEENSAK